MTLSRWLRDYLYVPLGGSHGSGAKTYRNLMLTMLLGGLWHGANWTFVVWGGIHGTGLVLERWWRRAQGPARPPGRSWRAPDLQPTVAAGVLRGRGVAPERGRFGTRKPRDVDARRRPTSRRCPDRRLWLSRGGDLQRRLLRLGVLPLARA